MNQSSVAVSVVIPCHNSAQYLAETVASVAAQSLRDHEVVLVDDGSTDGTRALIAALIASHRGPAMRMVAQARGGVASARNAGIRAARGRFILPLDADDLIAPAMLADCVRMLDADPAADVVCCDRQDFGDIEQRVASGPFELQRLKYFNQVAYCSMYRRELWQAGAGYRSNVDGFDDWDFWIAAAARGASGLHLPQAHLKHRRRGTSFMWSLLRDYERLHARIILNNSAVYAPAEVRQAADFLEHGTPSPMLRSARILYLGRYYAGYPAPAATTSEID
jgi:glycosyltransferase involved in cell wall biosynthesis